MTEGHRVSPLLPTRAPEQPAHPHTGAVGVPLRASDAVTCHLSRAGLPLGFLGTTTGHLEFPCVPLGSPAPATTKRRGASPLTLE